MFTITPKHIIKEIRVYDILISIGLFILTFPVFYPNYSIGLDTSYTWALNYLFDTSYNSLKEIVFPLGPLGFLKNALVIGKNFEFFLIFYFIIKVWFTFIFIQSAQQFSNRKEISYFIVAFLLMLFNIDYLLIGIVFIYCFSFLQTRNLFYIIPATIISFLALCIKTSIGLSGFSILFMSFVLLLTEKKDIKLYLHFLILVITSVLITGLFVFHSFYLLILYLINILKLSLSYSSSLSLFIPNNWLLLSLVIISVLLPIFLNKGLKTKYLFFLLLPSLFLMWKHGLTRQDYTHSLVFFVFLFLYWGIFIVLSDINIKKLIIIGIICITAFYWNLNNNWDFRPKTIEVNGIVNFQKIVLNLKSFKQQNINISEQNIRESKLEKRLLDAIGNSTIDAYPWELSYFAANPHLQWKMRNSLQSVNFGRWMDALNAIDFSREQGPEFLIFHYTQDKWQGGFGSIDERFILNDNPLATYSIFNTYDIFEKTNDFLLLKKNTSNNLSIVYSSPEYSSEFGKWIDINSNNDTIIRLKLTAKQNILGKIKSFLYKTEEYFVDYQLTDDNIFTYRYVPESANDGIWINPFIRNPQDNIIEQNVKKVRFRFTNSIFNNKKISYTIEKICYKSSTNQTNFNSYFKKTIRPVTQNIINHIQNFDNLNDSLKIPLTTIQSYSGKYSNEVTGNGGFSYTYTINLDTLWNTLDSAITS
ncbi:MAG: hypothetical protein SNJ64_04065, partial [Endomicrobiia bacterium]